MADEINYPRLVTGVYIVNNQRQIFLFVSPKWDGKLVPPGGHVEFCESWKESVIREAQEETGLKIKNVEELELVEFIKSLDYTKHKHIVSINCRAELDGDNQTVVLDNHEGTSFVWLTPEQAVMDPRVEETTKDIIAKHFIKNNENEKEINKKEKKLFFKKCANCQKKEEQCEEYKIGWQRALADYQNLQKEINNKKSEWIKMSEAQILEEFLPIYEHLKMSLSHQDNIEQTNSWLDGVKHVLKQFKDILAQHGIEEIKTVGAKFDPAFHEAVGTEQKQDLESGIIIKEMTGGYLLGGKTIKAARVIVNE